MGFLGSIIILCSAAPYQWDYNGITGILGSLLGIVTASNGDLLLAYEGREAGGNRRTLFFRRYQIKDGQPQPAGERITMVSPKGEELLHNPLLIAAPEGRVYFFWCQDYQRLFLRESHDNGETFGEERELTSLIDGFRKEWPEH